MVFHMQVKILYHPWINVGNTFFPRICKDQRRCYNYKLFS